MDIHGWIIYNGHLPGDKFLDFAEMFHEAANKLNVSTTIKKNNELYVQLHDTLEIVHDEVSLPDFIIFTDKDIYLAKQFELLGIPVFNSSSAIEISDDKIATYQALAKHNISIPNTIVQPKIYSNRTAIDHRFVHKVVEQLGFPMIIKEAFGSFGEQVYLIDNYDDLINKIEQLQEKPFMFQEFISSSYGKDIRLQVVGDEVVASMLRKSEHDFRANITAGGTMTPYQPTLLEQKLAIKATKAIGADFAGVDLLFGEDETPIVCEVNSNAHIRNMLDCTKINAADYIVKHIIEKLLHDEG